MPTDEVQNFVLQMDGTAIVKVKHFKYLGSAVVKYGDREMGVGGSK